MELDLKLTGEAFSCSLTTGRSTAAPPGKGLVSDYTLDELKKFRLKRAHGVATDSLHICTLREALECCKDNAVNVDQGYEYYDLVLALTEELGDVPTRS